MKKQQKTETPQNTTNTTKTSPFLDKNMISANKIMKNEANFNNLNSTATTCSAMVYGDLSPKTQNGTNPNEANLKPIFETENPFVFSGYPAKNKKMKSKANFENPRPTLTREIKTTYNNLWQNDHKKANPIQSQYFVK